MQDELAAQEKSQIEFTEMLERQRLQEQMESKKRKEQDTLMLKQERHLLLRQRQDLQAEVFYYIYAIISTTNYNNPPNSKQI